ncbi:MAG: response regulator [Actinomycetota bacterium]|nr:response regulator [Actinomycetota bacterium]
MRFLVVDDEPSVLLLVSANVRAWGHEVVTAATVDEARAHCEGGGIDVMLLDVSMPSMDGPTFLRSLRAAGCEPGRVFLLSAIAPEELERLAADLDVDHITKPFTAPGLRDALLPAIERAS